MNLQEYERLIGRTAEQAAAMDMYDRERDFTEANACYMLLRNVWKQEFCAVWSKKEYRMMIKGFCHTWGVAANRMHLKGELELFSEGVRALGEEILKLKGE